MKLNDLENKNYASIALKENFNVDQNFSKLGMAATQKMLSKVRGLIKEAKQTPTFYKDQTSGSYMKLVFMEQALSKHYGWLAQQPKARIVVENEEVEKSQTILAAQDMVDSIQKMIEEVNDMLVKELPALVASIESEISVEQSGAFNQQASEALTTLNQTLSQSKVTLKNALNSITGVGGAEAFGGPAATGDEMAVTDIGANADVTGGEEEIPMEPEMGAEELPAEEPEIPPVGGVGRAKR